MKTDKECTMCIHKEVCKTAESCDGYVSGCKHFAVISNLETTTREKLMHLISDVVELYKSEYEELADYLIANGVTVQEWISVKDRLPENEKCVLVYSQDGGAAEGKYNARFKEWVQFRWNVTELKNVTHWMLLPQPPKEFRREQYS